MPPVCVVTGPSSLQSALLDNTPGSQRSTLLAIDFHAHGWMDGEMAQQVKALPTKPYDDPSSVSRTHMVEGDSFKLTSHLHMHAYKIIHIYTNKCTFEI